jgi:hypothetical protein
VDHSVTDQTSILKFIVDNWGTGRVGDHSFDERAGSVQPMFDWRAHPDTRPVILDPASRAVVSRNCSVHPTDRFPSRAPGPVVSGSSGEGPPRG